jgi:hypothetical protein
MGIGRKGPPGSPTTTNRQTMTAYERYTFDTAPVHVAEAMLDQAKRESLANAIKIISQYSENLEGKISCWLHYLSDELEEPTCMPENWHPKVTDAHKESIQELRKLAYPSQPPMDEEEAESLAYRLAGGICD